MDQAGRQGVGEDVIELEDLTPLQWLDHCESRGWSDGLPTVPPTEDAVAAFLSAYSGPDDPFDPIPPNGVVPTLRSLAANAIMAGCRPDYFPIVLTALRAMLLPQYDLHGTLATTHSCANLVLVNGPARIRLGLNSGSNVFGQGTRANAAIGRAVQLIVRNIGGAHPGMTDRSTMGNPAKYGYCIAENEESSPWDPLHVRNGYEADDTVVTVMTAEGPHNINDHGSTTGTEILTTISQTMSQAGANNIYGKGPCLVALSPEHAATLHRDQWRIPDIQAELHERSRVHIARISAGNQENYKFLGSPPRDDHYYLTPRPDDIQVIVAGGAGKHSAYVPTFGLAGLAAMKVPGSAT